MERFREELRSELSTTSKPDLSALLKDASEGRLIRGAEEYINNNDILFDLTGYLVTDDDSWLPALWDESTLDIQESGVARVPVQHPANLIVIEEVSRELQRRVN